MAPKVAKAKSPQAKHTRAGGGGGNACDKIVLSLAQLRQIGILNPSREQVASYAGIQVKSSTMRNALTKLKREGLVDTSDPKTLMLTEKGINKVGTNVAQPTSNEEFHELIKKKITGKKSLEIFEILASGPPRTNGELAVMIGTEVTKSTYRNAKTPLYKLNLLEEVEGNRLQLTDFCFPLGRHGTMEALAAHGNVSESDGGSEYADV